MPPAEPERQDPSETEASGESELPTSLVPRWLALLVLLALLASAAYSTCALLR